MKPLESSKTYVASDGVGIRYWLTWRQGMKRQFVVLHPGSAVNHSSLERLEQEINNAGYPTVNFDHREAGYSAAPADARFHQLGCYTADLAGIIHQEGIERPVLLSHSFGFMPAVGYTAATGNAAHIIGIGASRNFRESARSKAAMELWRRIPHINNYVTSAALQLSHLLLRQPRGYADMSDLEGCSELAVYLKLADVAFRDLRRYDVGIKEIMKWDVSREVASIKAQFTLVYGEQDLMVPPSAAAFIASGTSAPCKVIVLPGRHGLPVTQPREVFRAILPSLERIN